MYFHTDNRRDLAWLSAVADTCVDMARSLRIETDDKGRMRMKAGGAWSPWLAGTPDMSRDKSFDNVVPEKDYSKGMTFMEVVSDLINMDALIAAEPAIRHIYNKVIQEAIEVPEPFSFAKSTTIPHP